MISQELLLHPRSGKSYNKLLQTNYIEGLFLSSAVVKNPNHTMELLYESLRILRKEYRFNGYIHVKAIPGADLGLIEAVGNWLTE